MTDYIIDLPGEEISEKLKQVDAKQDIIEDLDSIRDGAQKGSKAISSVTLNGIRHIEGENASFTGINLGIVVTKIKVNGKDYSPSSLLGSSGVVDLGEIYTKKEVDSAIAKAITTTINTPV